MPSSSSRQARFWLLTIPRQDWAPPTALKPNWQFIKGQAETGDSGYEHWQICVGYKSKVRLGTLKADFCQSCHAEPTRSEAAEAYVHKEETSVPGTRFELGAKALNRNSKDYWDEQWKLAASGNWKNCDSDVKFRYYNTLKKIALEFGPKPVALPSVCGIWIMGPPGVGKSHLAREWFPEAYEKNLNKWWDGYGGEKQVILDDVDHNQESWIGHFLKIWADKYPFQAEQKGGTILIRPEKIVVTSNYSIEQLFAQDVAMCEAIKRRFYLIIIPNKRY